MKGKKPRTYHHIVFTNPSVVKDDTQRFKIHNRLWKKLCAAPKVIGGRYVFGRKFPVNMYVEIKTFPSPKVISIMDMDEFDKTTQSTVKSALKSAYETTDWNDRSALRKVRKTIPHILYIGVASSLHVHYAGSFIDGVMIA